MLLRPTIPCRQVVAAHESSADVAAHESSADRDAYGSSADASGKSAAPRAGFQAGIGHLRSYGLNAIHLRSAPCEMNLHFSTDDSDEI